MDVILSFFQNFLETLWTWVLPSIFRILLIVLIALAVQHMLNISITNSIRKLHKIRRIGTLSQIIHSTSSVIIIAIASLMILHEIGFDVRPIIAGAGILSLAISLGAQHLVKDVVNGFLILVEDQFGIGDTVKIGDLTGRVEVMNLRTTTLKDSGGSTHIIPNGQIIQVTVISKGSI